MNLKFLLSNFIFIIYGISNSFCQSTWTISDDKSYVNSCIEQLDKSTKINALNWSSYLKEIYCQCTLDKVKIKYPSAQSLGNITVQQLTDFSSECINAISEYKEGLSKEGNKNYTEAVTNYTRAINFYPKFKEAFLGRGRANETYVLSLVQKNQNTSDMKSRCQNAIDDYLKVIDFDSNNSKAYYGVCLNTMMQNKKEEACFYCKRALQLGYSDNSNALFKFCK